MRVAVVGHVEWVQFLMVDHTPGIGGIAHAHGGWSEPAGGGATAAVDLARQVGSCRFVTAIGSDAVGARIEPVLRRHGVEVEAAVRSEAQRQAITLIDPGRDRTIIVIGPSQVPRSSDGLGIDDFADLDAVYFCKGDAALLRAARRARTLVATARVLDVVQEANVVLDALVRSAVDPSEQYRPGDLALEPRLVASTEGASGGAFVVPGTGRQGRWEAEVLPGPPQDAYGSGDCFAGGLALALARGEPVEKALAYAASRGAAANCRRGNTGRSSS